MGGGYISIFPDGASGNSVTVGANVPGHVYGGRDYHTDSTDANISNNQAVLNNGIVGDTVYGGFAESRTGTATATSNNAVVNGGTVSGWVYGGFARSYSGTAIATGNSVVVNGGTVSGRVYGAYSRTDSTGTPIATGNSVVVNGGTVSGWACGAYSRTNTGSTGTAIATANSAVVNGGTVSGNVYGGFTQSDSGNATSTANSVVVNGGTVSGEVCGGFARSNSGNATATGNSVVVNGGTVKNDIIGGWARSDSGNATATGNSVTLSGSPLFDAGVNILGGNHGGTGNDRFTDNILNVWNYTGSSAVRNVRNFQYYNFILPASLHNGQTLFTVTDTAWFDDSPSGTPHGVVSSITGVSIMGGGDPLRAGDSVTLMRYGILSNNVYAANGNSLIRGQKGVSLLYDFQLSQTDTDLNATVARVQAHPQAKALSEGRVAGLALVNQGADLIAGTGMDAARRAASPSGGAGFSPFFAFQGGTARYDTGSHADLDGFSLLAGLAWNREAAGGRLLLGAFFESGWGDYDSRNAFNGFASVQGEGDTQYYGGGVLGRLEFPRAAQDARPSVLYVEASARAGWADTDFSSHDLRDGMGRNATYASGAAYYGAHLGLGYVWNLTDRSSLDVYTRYFWTRQDGDAVSVTDDPIRFESSDSHRWRAGARFSHALTTAGGLVVTPYLGAAWEHEFDGRAKATAYGYDLDAPDLTGGTGIGELGVSFKPSAASGVSLDLAVRGHAGVRRGVSGGFQARWEF